MHMLDLLRDIPTAKDLQLSSHFLCRVSTNWPRDIELTEPCLAQSVAYRYRYHTTARFDTTTTGFLHNRLVELLAIRTSAHQNISSGNCKKGADDCSFCFECSNIYCCSCLEAHAVIKAEHRVRALKEFHTEDYQDFLQRPVLCSEKFHENQPFVLYCNQCERCLCQFCIAVTANQRIHSEHEIVPLVEAAEIKMTSLLADIIKLNQKKENLDEVIQKMDEIIGEIDENVDSAKAEVQQLADLLIANIFKHCEASLAELGCSGLQKGDRKRQETEI